MRDAWPAHPFFIEDTIRHHSVCYQSGRKKIYVNWFFFFSEWKYMKWLLQFFHALSGSKQKTIDGEMKFIVKPSIC